VVNYCIFCGPTDNKITKEHVWPMWIAAADADERRAIVLGAIHAAITTVAGHNTGVSALIQVGIHDSVGNIRISNIAAIPADLRFPDDEDE